MKKKTAQGSGNRNLLSFPKHDSFTTLRDRSLFYMALKFHVVCTCTFFGNTICLLTNRKMIKIVTLIDLRMVLTYMTVGIAF